MSNGSSNDILITLLKSDFKQNQKNKILSLLGSNDVALGRDVLLCLADPTFSDKDFKDLFDKIIDHKNFDQAVLLEADNQDKYIWEYFPKKKHKIFYNKLNTLREQFDSKITSWIKASTPGQIRKNIEEIETESLGRLIKQLKVLQKVVGNETTVHSIAGLEARSIIKEYDNIAEARRAKALRDTYQLLNDPSNEQAKRYEENAEAMLNTKQERMGLAMIAIGAAVVGALLLGALFAPATLSSGAFLLGCVGFFSATALSFWGYQKQKSARKRNKTAHAMQDVSEQTSVLNL